MSVATPVYQIETENNTVGNFFKAAGKYGIALSILGSVPTVAHIAHVSDLSMHPQLKMISGLSSTSLSKPIEREKELNQFSFNKGFNSPTTEYVKSNFITLNGSLLEANFEMETDPDNYGTLSNDDMVFDFSFEPTPKKTFNLPSELTIIKDAKPTHQYYADDFLQDEVSFEPTPKRTFML